MKQQTLTDMQSITNLQTRLSNLFLTWMTL